MQKITHNILISQLFLLLTTLFSTTANAVPTDGEAFDNWTVRCEQSEGRESCFIFQNLVLQNGGDSILHVAVGYLPGNKKEAVILVSMPLGISLPLGANIKIDEQEPTKFEIERCETSGCRGGFRLKDDMLQSFRMGKTAMVTFYDGHRKAIEMPLSLIGFSAGIDALEL